MVWYFSPLVYWYIILYHPLLVWYSHAMAWDSHRGRRFRFLRLEPSMNWTSWLRSSSRNGFFFVDQLTGSTFSKPCWHQKGLKKSLVIRCAIFMGKWPLFQWPWLLCRIIAMLVITRGWPLLAALLDSEASTQAMWPIVARKGQQMQSSKKPGRWLKTFRTKKCGPEGSAWHISSPAATVLQLHMLHCSESFFIDDYDDFSVPSQAAIYIKIMQKIKEKGEAHQHGDVFRSELVLFFCDTLVDTCWQ